MSKNESLHKFAIDKLEKIRDDDNLPSQNRLAAINAIEKLSDPPEYSNSSRDYILKLLDEILSRIKEDDPEIAKIYTQILDHLKENE